MRKDEILKSMLDHISDEYDTSQGSFFYDALAPIANALQEAYEKQETILKEGFVATATGGYLDKKAVEQGIIRKKPTKATTDVKITGQKGTHILKGTKVMSHAVEFTVIEEGIIGEEGYAFVKVECDEEGSIGNIGVGEIMDFPVIISGLDHVTNLDPVTNGYDGEDDESLRQRYFEKVRTPATSGNKQHYRNWAKEIAGVGDARIFPSTLKEEEGILKGDGLVRVVLIDENMHGANEDLIQRVENHIEIKRPIGASVKVISAIEVPLHIEVELKMDTNNYTKDEIQNNIEENIITYLKQRAYIDGYISYAKIGSSILKAEGVKDYTHLKVRAEDEVIDPNTGMLSIEDTQVVVLENVTILEAGGIG